MAIDAYAAGGIRDNFASLQTQEFEKPLTISVTSCTDQAIKKEVANALREWEVLSDLLADEEECESEAYTKLKEVSGISFSLLNEMQKVKYDIAQDFILARDQDTRIQAVALVRINFEVTYLVSAPWNVRCVSAKNFAEEEGIQRVHGAATGCLLGAIKSDKKKSFCTLGLDSLPNAASFYESRRFTSTNDVRMFLSEDDAQKLFQEHAWKYSFTHN